MRTVTQTRCKKPAQRTMSIGKPVNGTFALKLCVGRSITGYYCTRLSPDVFNLLKFGADAGTDGEEREYHVNLTDQQHGCSCRGYLKHGHCKHRDSLSALVSSGRVA